VSSGAPAEIKGKAQRFQMPISLITCSAGTGPSAGALNRFGDTTNARAYPAGQTLGQTANFRQTAPKIHVSPGFAAYFGPPPPKRISTPMRGGARDGRGQTGLAANFRQTAPEIHASLVSPKVA